MPIISVEIMKTIDEREMQKTTKEKQRSRIKDEGINNQNLTLQTYHKSTYA